MSLSQSMLRQQARAARKQLLPDYRQSASQIIRESLKQMLRSVKNLAVYFPIGGEEVDLFDLVDWAFAREKEIAVPLIQGNILLFVPVRPETRFQKNKWNILEPIVPEGFEGINPKSLEAICLPLVAFDEHLHRIGQGRGFYDRTLASCMAEPERPVFIGCAFECQKVSGILPQPHDVRLDAVVTEKAVWQKDFRLNRGGFNR